MKLNGISSLFRSVDSRLSAECFGYLAINGLFVIKYSARAGVWPLPAVGIYILLVCTGAVAVSFLTGKPAKEKAVWYGISILVVMATLIGLVVTIDPYSLSVDRWSALHHVVRGVLDGQHPFTIRSHMDQQASPFPVMYLLASPFFLIGDVGYLQCGCFLCTTLIVAKLAGINKAIWLNALVIMSPAFWYEGAVRSDLFSNFLLVALFIYIAVMVQQRSIGTHCVIAAVAGLLLCTRGAVMLPLIIFFGYYMKGVPVGQWLVMVIIAVCMAILPFVPLAVWDPHIFVTLNPALLQSEKSPRIVQVLTLVLVILTAYKVTAAQNIFRFAFLILFSLMTVSFVVMIARFGYTAAFTGSLFDITYFSIALPFCFFSFVMHRGAVEYQARRRPVLRGKL